MDISRELAIQILKYLDKHRDFYFPFQIMNRLGSGREAGCVEVEPCEWKNIKKDGKNQSFQLWENLQNLDKDTTALLADGFIKKITGNPKEVTFTITEDEVRQVAEKGLGQKLSGKQVQEVLDMVEYDEMFAKDIRTAIIGAIREVQS